MQIFVSSKSSSCSFVNAAVDASATVVTVVVGAKLMLCLVFSRNCCPSYLEFDTELLYPAQAAHLTRWRQRHADPPRTLIRGYQPPHVKGRREHPADPTSSEERREGGGRASEGEEKRRQTMER